MEEQINRVLVEGEMAVLVEHQQAITAQPGQFRGALAAGVGFLQPCHPAGRSVAQNPVAGPRRPYPDTDREMRFPGPGRPEENHILAPGEKDVGAADFPFGALFREDRCKVFLMRPTGIAGEVAETTERVAVAGCAQGASVVLDLRCRHRPARPGQNATAKIVGVVASVMKSLRSMAGVAGVGLETGTAAPPLGSHGMGR